VFCIETQTADGSRICLAVAACLDEGLGSPSSTRPRGRCHPHIPVDAKRITRVITVRRSSGTRSRSATACRGGNDAPCTRSVPGSKHGAAEFEGWELRWFENQAGLIDEAVEEAAAVLHSLQLCFDHRGELVGVAGGEVGQAVFQVGPQALSLVVTVQG
jgi:hypothetical protein